MPTPTFQRLSVDQFATLLQKFPFQRRINAVHMHHTWRPNRQQFRGHESIVAMWRFHTQTNGWSDIGQHITIDPQGTIWLGRNWNLPPASASGHNGNRSAGPFMFEMVGDFDSGPGHDTFDGAQTRHFSSLGSRPTSSAALRAVAIVHSMIAGSASWMITPSPTRPATPSARGP